MASNSCASMPALPSALLAALAPIVIVLSAAPANARVATPVCSNTQPDGLPSRSSRSSDATRFGGIYSPVPKICRAICRLLTIRPPPIRDVGSVVRQPTGNPAGLHWNRATRCQVSRNDTSSVVTLGHRKRDFRSLGAVVFRTRVRLICGILAADGYLPVRDQGSPDDSCRVEQ